MNERKNEWTNEKSNISKAHDVSIFRIDTNRPFENSVYFYPITRRHFPQDDKIHSHLRLKLSRTRYMK